MKNFYCVGAYLYECLIISHWSYTTTVWLIVDGISICYAIKYIFNILAVLECHIRKGYMIKQVIFSLPIKYIFSILALPVCPEIVICVLYQCLLWTTTIRSQHCSCKTVILLCNNCPQRGVMPHFMWWPGNKYITIHHLKQLCRSVSIIMTNSNIGFEKSGTTMNLLIILIYLFF